MGKIFRVPSHHPIKSSEVPEEIKPPPSDEGQKNELPSFSLKPILRKQRTYNTPEPTIIGNRKYARDIPRIIFHPSKNDPHYAELFNYIVDISSNGDKPMKISDLDPTIQQDVVWMLTSHGINLEEGGEMVH